MTQEEVKDALDNVLRLAGSDCMSLFNHLLDRLSNVESAVGITNNANSDNSQEQLDTTPVEQLDTTLVRRGRGN